jgi:hypothetical protein
MIHQNSFNLFRVNEWPKAQASHYMYFKPPRVKYDLNLIFDHIAHELHETHRGYVKWPTFTLVNVYSFIASLSFGNQRPPHKRVRDDLSPLNVTFAFSHDSNYDGTYEPRFKQHRTFRSTIWGTRFEQSRAFMTTDVPHILMEEANLLVPNLQELAWLYMAIGAFSKGFVKRHHYFSDDGELFRADPIPPALAYSQYYFKSMPFMFKNAPWCEWIYCREMWTLSPNIFSARSFTDDVIEYYCRYLAKDFYKKTEATVAGVLEEKAFALVRSGLLDILSEDVHTSRYIDVVNAMTGHFRIEKTINVEETAERILMGTLQ